MNENETGGGGAHGRLYASGYLVCEGQVEQGRMGTMRPNVVTDIIYRSRDIGYGVEEGSIEGFWTGEVDGSGKYTIQDITGGPTLYLFDDELVSVNDRPTAFDRTGPATKPQRPLQDEARATWGQVK
jgi:hypothetical protein